MNPTLYDSTLTDLEALMQQHGQPPFRARQIYHQLYKNHAGAMDAMTDLPRALRQTLADHVPFSNLHLVHVQHSHDRQTRKAIFALPDGAVVETVLMIYPERVTVCVSTQAGCAVGCVFCATGKMGLLHNLCTGDIVAQVLWAVQEMQQQPHESPAVAHVNVVFMGMGEPFANYDHWWGAVERLHDPNGFGLGARRMTVSTVGVVPGIHRLAEESLPINLAISLHAPDDALRSELVPINRRYPIAPLLEATRTYVEKTGRRVSFEYILLHGRNDQEDQARRLAALLRSAATPGQTLLYHVNLIPWNPVPGTRLSRSNQQRVLAFQHILQDHHIACTVRVERGGEIAAACGQLAGQLRTVQENLSPIERNPAP